VNPVQAKKKPKRPSHIIYPSATASVEAIQE